MLLLAVILTVPYVGAFGINNDGAEEWSWKLHFKYVNSPVTLIVNDHNGFATEFTTTDLNKALVLRNTKTIKEY